MTPPLTIEQLDAMEPLERAKAMFREIATALGGMMAAGKPPRELARYAAAGSLAIEGVLRTMTPLDRARFKAWEAEERVRVLEKMAARANAPVAPRVASEPGDAPTEGGRTESPQNGACGTQERTEAERCPNHAIIASTRTDGARKPANHTSIGSIRPRTNPGKQRIRRQSNDRRHSRSADPGRIEYAHIHA